MQLGQKPQWTKPPDAAQRIVPDPPQPETNLWCTVEQPQRKGQIQKCKRPGQRDYQRPLGRRHPDTHERLGRDESARVERVELRNKFDHLQARDEQQEREGDRVYRQLLRDDGQGSRKREHGEQRQRRLNLVRPHDDTPLV